MRPTDTETALPSPVAGQIRPPTGGPSPADEANHRIANNLQLVSALISGEARILESHEAREALYRMQARITAIANVHRLLQGSGTDQSVDLQDFLERLCAQFAQYCPDHRRLILRAVPVAVGAEAATLIGMLATELVTNACKFAYQATEPGDIFITLGTLGGAGYQVTIEDHGCGVIGRTQGTGLGQRLIASTAQQLGGVATWEDAAPGLRFRLSIAQSAA